MKLKVYKTNQTRNAIWGRDMGYNEEARKRIGVNKMRILRWMCGMTCKDKIRNEHVQGTIESGIGWRRA